MKRFLYLLSVYQKLTRSSTWYILTGFLFLITHGELHSSCSLSFLNSLLWNLSQIQAAFFGPYKNLWTSWRTYFTPHHRNRIFVAWQTKHGAAVHSVERFQKPSDSHPRPSTSTCTLPFFYGIVRLRGRAFDMRTMHFDSINHPSRFVIHQFVSFVFCTIIRTSSIKLSVAWILLPVFNTAYSVEL